MKVLKLKDAIKSLGRLTDEIDASTFFSGKTFTSGLIRFRPRHIPDAKQIIHEDYDVICKVIKGNGKLRIGDQITELSDETFCHIPLGTPHDFYTDDLKGMTLFYVQVKST